jgi:hypothetical protein
LYVVLSIWYWSRNSNIGKSIAFSLLSRPGCPSAM